jgi:hypothetical protein
MTLKRSQHVPDGLPLRYFGLCLPPPRPRLSAT